MRFSIEKTAHSPLMKFEDGVLLIEGRSIPEDSFSVYEPLFKFIERFSADFQNIEIQFRLEYANSSTNRSLMTLFEIMEEHQTKGNNIVISWYYAINDKEMLDLGSDFKDLVPFKFELKEVESLDSIS